MNTIGMIGMGRMGQAIAGQLERLPGVRMEPFTRLNQGDENRLKTCDVVIEFTTPEAAPAVIRQCLQAGIPVVSGTTGWHEYHLPSMISLRTQLGGKFLYATNFSIGMNIVFALNAKLANALKRYPAFVPSLREVHHIHKKDAPSGTAYTLLGQIIDQRPDYTGFALNHPADQHEIEVTAIREGEGKGFHEVTWQSGGERISITHEAFDRGIFASGAIAAAQWLLDQPAGVYTMQDLIHL
jgi:4-hydroxy-tetrahydrodipicolinate reductase